MVLRVPLPLSQPADPPQDQVGLVDTFGRIHNNLRISVTDRCNLRCVYCMPEEVTFRDRSELLTFEEIRDFVRIVAPLGIDKIRLTGGEPLMRRRLPKLIEMLVQVPGIRDVGLTTNGILLAEHARSLREAGLHRINVSLDTLDPERFRQLTRRDGLEAVLKGIEAAQQAGFERVKINAVSIRGVSEHDAVPLARYARLNGLELRFIEYMPIGANAWERQKVFFAHEIVALLEAEFGPLIPAADADPRSPAQDYVYADGGGRVGLIASISRPFCHSCNRIRLTAEGKLRNCLFSLEEVDIKTLLRRSPTPDETGIIAAVRRSVWTKWEGHEINTARFIKPERTMHTIGG